MNDGERIGLREPPLIVSEKARGERVWKRNAAYNSVLINDCHEREMIVRVYEYRAFFKCQRRGKRIVYDSNHNFYERVCVNTLVGSDIFCFYFSWFRSLN